MTTIDDKVVAMSFESSKFESGVDKTIKALERLKAALHMPDAGRSMVAIGTAAKAAAPDLGHIGKGIDEISSKLNAFRLAAIAVFAQVASKAIAAGTQFAKAFTLDPIKAGFKEYTTNLNAVQTILANTQAAGTKLQDVNEALRVLNEYSDKTIYNFAQMARNIGTFTAAGVDLDTATESIKGIANLAALSGSNAEQAATAMYQLSQAISAGRVSLMDWNSVVNAGMGGTVFQRALAQTAVAMGTLDEKSLKLTGSMKNVTIAGESFRNSLSPKPGEESWLTSEVLTTTLKTFTSDLNKAELAAIGFNKEQIAAIQRTATTAMKAATEVKTLEGVLTTAKETAASGWAQTWQIIFGDFGEAKELFTGVSNAVNGFINASADARNKVLKDWKALGGRTALIEAFKNVFEALAAVVKPIREAFREFFPAITGRQLANLTKDFKEFTETLMPSEETLRNLKRTFRGVFAVLDIGRMIVVGIASVFGKLFDALGTGDGDFLKFTARIGDFLVSVNEALKRGDRLQKFFEGLGTALAAPIKLLSKLASAIGKIFSAGISGQMDQMAGSTSVFQRALEGLSTALGEFLDLFGDFGAIFKPLVEAYTEGLKQLGPAIGDAISNMNWEVVLQAIRTGLFAGIFLLFKRFLGGGPFVEQLTRGFSGIGGGIIGNISQSFASLSGALGALQQNIKAKTLKEIAIAVALLAASIVALSFVDPKKLNSALSAITIAFGQLLGAMAILGHISKSMGFIKIPVIAASLILLAGAIDVLAIAVIALSFLSWEELIKGLGGVGALLVGMVAATGPLSKASPRLIVAGLGIQAIGVGLNILALAIRQMGSMDLEQLAKGLGSVAVGLGIIVKTTAVMPTKGLLVSGAGILVLAVALNVLALAIRQLGSMDWRTLGTGLAGVGASLVVIAGAMRLMPKSMVITAAGLLLVSLALGKISDAVVKMGGMSIRQVAKGLIALGGALAILAAGMHLMRGAITGALSLTIAAAGISLLTGSLVTLGQLSWGKIIKGLVALAAVLAVVSIAAIALAPAAPAMLAFGAALLVIGAGIALVGAGIALIGIGLSAIAASGSVAIGVLIQALIDLQEAIPRIVKNTILGLLEIVKGLAEVAPEFVDALVEILYAMIDVFIKAAPKIKEAMGVLIQLLIDVLDQNQDKIIQAGFDLLIALLKGIRDNIGEVVKMVVDIVANFLNALAKNLRKIIDAGANVLIQFLKGIAKGYADVAKAALSIISTFLSAIGSGLGKIATAGLSILTKFLGAIAGGLSKVIKAGTDVIVAWITGIGNAGPRIVTAATSAMIKFVNAISKNAVRLADAGAVAIINFLNGVADVIEKREPEMIRAGARIGTAIVTGMIRGLGSLAPQLYNKAKEIAGKALDILKKPWKVLSPSKVTEELGENIIRGMIVGLDSNAKNVYASAESLSNGIIDTFKNVFQITSPSEVMREIGMFVGQGFAQGLRGSTQDINAAFSDMNSKLTEAMRDARATIIEEQNKLDELRKAKKPDKAEIKEIQDVIKQNQDLLARSTAGHIALTKALKDEKVELLGLVNDYNKISEKLSKAQDNLQNLIDIRDQAIAGFAEQYGDLPDIVTEKDGELLSGAQQVEEYIKSLGGTIDSVRKFNETLEKLRGLGLDDTTYQMLLEEGPSAQAFADALLEGGPELIKSMNTLDKKLEGAANTLAKNAGKNLYQAGVDAAQGLVDGLKSKQSDLRKEIKKIARIIIKELKDELGIKSPSREFAEIAKFAMEGMAKGFTDSSKIVTDAVDSAANDALTAMEQSMRDISNVVASEIDPNPVITPILDLSQVRSKVGELAAITASASYGQAIAISSSEMTAQEQIDKDIEARGASITFEQNNYSPQALTEIEIYRQTRNQLSQLKSVLAPT